MCEAAEMNEAPSRAGNVVSKLQYLIFFYIAINLHVMFVFVIKRDSIYLITIS